MNIFWLLQSGDPFFSKWQVEVNIFWLVEGGVGWWWLVVDIFWLVVDGGGSWWIVVGDGMIQFDTFQQSSLIIYYKSIPFQEKAPNGLVLPIMNF